MPATSMDNEETKRALTGRDRNADRVAQGKPPLGRPRGRNPRRDPPKVGKGNSKAASSTLGCMYPCVADFRAYIREKVRNRDRDTCRYCGKVCTGPIHLDHVIPSSRGGGDSDTNLVVACVECNMRKGQRTPEEAGMPMPSGVVLPSVILPTSVGGSSPLFRVLVRRIPGQILALIREIAKETGSLHDAARVLRVPAWELYRAWSTAPADIRGPELREREP